MPKRSMGFMPRASWGCGVVVVLDPVGELAVEGFERGEVRVAGQELIADSAEKSFDFSLGRGIANGGVTQEAADAGADEGDFLGAVDGAVVDEELLGDAAFVEGGAEGFDERVDVFLEEELAVAADAAGVVEEGDELGLACGAPLMLTVGAEQGVGLPELVGVFAEGQAFLVGRSPRRAEQVVLADEAVEGVGRDAVGCSSPFSMQKR